MGCLLRMRRVSRNTDFIVKTVHASILGDGYFYKVDQCNPKANTHYMLKQLSTHLDYVEWMANILEDVTRVTLNIDSAYIDKRGYNCKEQIILKTMRDPMYKKMYNDLYEPQGNTHIKKLNVDYLKLVDWSDLAMLYMDDGWLDVKPCKTKEDYVRASIATHCFTYNENVVLRGILKEKFGILSSIINHKQKSGEYRYYISMTKDDGKRFLDGIRPFVFDSFSYKLY